MIIAAFGNLFGNQNALEIIRASIQDEGIMTMVHTGNLVVGHPENSKVIKSIQNNQIAGVQGIHEKNLVKLLRKRSTLQKKMMPQEFEILEKTFDECTSDELEFLRNLPAKTTLKVDGVAVTIVYGSLSSHKEELTSNDPLVRFERLREMTPARIIILGGKSDAFVKEVHGTIIVHPGNASGNSNGLGEYAIVNTEEDPWRAEIRTISLQT
jgi:predicted phosphodiesterase